MNAFETAYTKNKKEPNTLNVFLFNVGRTIPGVYYRKESGFLSLHVKEQLKPLSK